MITISESATDKIKELLASEESPNLFLRLGVKAGGCSGFSYGMGFDNEQKDDDKEFTIHGLKVVVDADSSKYLYGVQIDFEDKGMGGGFTINNPNAVASCGCGQSFRTKEEDAVLAQPCED
ncbi:HesB/IscA family protein [Paenibacillus sp. GCM10023248]|uniref:HesB/IscA family protein n=1 Tax=Bacillales TaxID=1385 RepID=UPI00237874D1|nr:MULTISPECIES: iron-sulfur cluster assembly accessory protein [Bacillales]MDD9271311.1 iron-sulfur cluster assembly accessory protein [Paenibacillus sp. MAHUQ-63]MDR6881567.1 iron-sulfur cluster assembly protein [Bacillus sp. 3255]